VANTESAISKVVVAGHVDHGKSTLLGRLLLNAGCIPADKVEKVQRVCEEKAINFEPAFVLDALKEEQEQGISIDSARFIIDLKGTKLVLIDAPGHVEFLKNMTSGASAANFGLLIVDAVDGIQNQTVQHCKVLSLLGIRKIIVVVNKMDRLGFAQEPFDRLYRELNEMIGQYQIRCHAFVPVSALMGENISSCSDKLPWYLGKSLAEELIDAARGHAQDDSRSAAQFRMILQDVYKDNEERYFVGAVLSGRLRPGSPVYFSPSGKVSTVKSIVKYPEKSLSEAISGDSIAITLVEQIFVERGEVISFPHEVPDSESTLKARIVWLSSEPFTPDMNYLLKVGTAEVPCRVTALGRVAGEHLQANGEFINVIIETKSPVAADTEGPLSQFVLCSTYETIAAGVINGVGTVVLQENKKNRFIQSQENVVDRVQREEKAGHKGCVLWLTGISGSGKTTLAQELEKKFFADGRNVITLDGDAIRQGLSSDLNFSKESRAENIRRIAHTAKLFLDAGFIVLVACISPYAQDRAAACDIVGDTDYLEVFLSCPIEECQKRDAKGLYKRAKTGEIIGFTGIAAPYQTPKSPALQVDSASLSLQEEVELVVELIADRFVSAPISKVGIAESQLAASAADRRHIGVLSGIGLNERGEIG
jgi:bifunctional enzyme CysN/CysC